MDATLNSGQSWEDPYSDLSIQIGSATNSGLQVTVSYGATPTCSPNPPTINVSPNSKSTDYPAPANYTVSVTNNDTSACSSASFSMTSKALFSGSVTSEVSTALNNSVLTIAPGATKTTTLVATPAIQPPDARNYMVSAKASRSNPNQSAEDEAGLTVVPPLQCIVATPSISLSPTNRTAEFPAGTSYTVSLTNNDNSACTATSFSMTATAALNGQNAGNISTTIASSLSIAPGATKTTTVTATPTSAPSTNSTYSITAKAIRSNPAQTVQDSSNFTVTLAPVCEVALPTVNLSPNSRSTEYPNPAGYTLTVVNNDSSVCSASSFSIGASATGAASANPSSGVLSIAPGATKTTTVTATPTSLPSSTTNHTVTASVSRSNPSQLVQDASQLTVDPPAATCELALPTISVNPTNGTTEYPSPMSYLVSLTNNDSAACQASTFSLTSNALFGGQPTAEVSAALGNSGLTIAPGATATTSIIATPLVLPAQSKAYSVAAAASRAAQAGAALGSVGFTVTPPPTEPPPPPPPSSTVDVIISVIGSRGSIELDPLGISCPGGCTTTIDTNNWEPLTLTAIPSGNSCVQAITGCDASSGNSCTLSAAQNYEITVEFGRCARGGGKGGGKGRVKRIAESTDATSTGRGRRR
jgi:hypothetical protein